MNTAGFTRTGAQSIATAIERRMPLVRRVTIALILFGGGLLSKASAETLLDRTWGQSARSAVENQIANPEASKSLAPVEGLDGQAAEAATAKYRKSFSREAPAGASSINLVPVGAASGSGQ